MNWPGTTEEIPDFLRHGLRIFHHVRMAGDLLGGSGQRTLPGYLALSFVRNALVAQITAHLPGAMDTFTMAQVVGVLSSSAVSALSRRSPRHPAAVVIYTSSFSALSRRCFFAFSAWHLTSISPLVSRHYFTTIKLSHQYFTINYFTIIIMPPLYYYTTIILPSSCHYLSLTIMAQLHLIIKLSHHYLAVFHHN